MTKQDYIDKVFTIQSLEYMSSMDMARELKISYNTLMRLKVSPDTCLLKTLRKIKTFVDKWESKNKEATA